VLGVGLGLRLGHGRVGLLSLLLINALIVELLELVVFLERVIVHARAYLKHEVSQVALEDHASSVPNLNEHARFGKSLGLDKASIGRQKYTVSELQKVVRGIHSSV